MVQDLQVNHQGAESNCKRSTHRLDGKLVPAGREELAAVRSLDVGRVVDSPPGKLREGFAGNVASSVLHSEDGLLRVGWKEGESSGVSKASGERQTRPQWNLPVSKIQYERRRSE